MTLAFQYLAPDSNGDMAIEGRRLRVYTILGEYEMGMSAEAIADEYSVPLGAVYEALAYAVEHPEEMETISREDDEAYIIWKNALPNEQVRKAAEDGHAAVRRHREEATRKAREARRSPSVP